MQEARFPDLLATLCNNMSANGSVCQAFLFLNHSDGLYGWFKGQPATTPFNFDNAYREVTSTMWVLDTGR